MVENELDQLEATEPSSKVPRAVLDDDDFVDLGELFRKLNRNRKTIFRASLIICALTTTIAFLLPVRYTSTTSFIPPANLNSGNSLATLISGQLTSLGASDLLGGTKTPGDLYAGILQSHSIAVELVKRFDLMHEYKVTKESRAEKTLNSNTDVVVDPKSTIVTLSVTDKSPERARDLASAYMDALRETNGRLALNQSSQRRLFFGQQLEKEKNDLEDAEVEMKKTEEQSGLIAPTGQTATEINTVAQTQAQIAVREVELAALHESATEQNPDVIRLRSEISDLRDQLSRIQKGSDQESTLAIPTSKVPELQLEYVRREREVKYHEALFDMLSRQYEAARLDEARDAPMLQVLDPASYPDTKSSPKRLYYMLGGLLFGFVASSLWVLVREPLRALRAALAVSRTA